VALNDDTTILEKLYQLIRRHPGNRPLQLSIVSKLQNVVIESAIGVENGVLLEIEKLDGVDII
jgi:DNA polymerase-3 subunit alpha